MGAGRVQGGCREGAGRVQGRAYRLVRDDDLGGVEERDARLELLGAEGDDGIRALLADGERLTDSEDALEALLKDLSYGMGCMNNGTTANGAGVAACGRV